MNVRRYPFKSRRLRKKYHQKEFAEYGFDVSGGYNDKCNIDEVMMSLADFIEKDGIYFGGGYGDESWTFSFGKEHGSITLDEKNRIIEEIRKTNVLRIDNISDFVDMWYEKRKHGHKG